MCRQSTKATVHHVSLKPIICQMKWIVTNAILYYSFLRSHLVISVVVVVVVLSSHLLFSYNEIQFLGLVCLELLFLFGQSHVDNFFRIFFTNCFSCGCCCFFRQFVFFFTVIVVIAPSHGILIENYLLPFGFLNLQNLLPFRIARHFHHFRCCCCFSWLSSIRYNYAVHLSGSFNFQCRAASWLCLSLRSLSCFQHLIAVLDSRTRSQC